MSDCCGSASRPSFVCQQQRRLLIGAILRPSYGHNRQMSRTIQSEPALLHYPAREAPERLHIFMQILCKWVDGIFVPPFFYLFFGFFCCWLICAPSVVVDLLLRQGARPSWNPTLLQSLWHVGRFFQMLNNPLRWPSSPPPSLTLPSIFQVSNLPLTLIRLSVPFFWSI